MRVPRRRKEDKHDRIISRPELRRVLLPAVPARHRAIVATAAGAGLRWGEAAGLRTDALDLDGRELRVVHTVIEVSGHTSFKAFPKSAAGRRTVPLPSWLVTIIREHRDRWPPSSDVPVFANEVGGPLRRTLFRSRIWRPSLVRAGHLGTLDADPDGGYQAGWTDSNGTAHAQRFATEPAAVSHIVRNQADGLRLHDLRHSYAKRRRAAQHGAAGHRTRTGIDNAGPVHPADRQRGSHPAALTDEDDPDDEHGSTGVLAAI